ncbi:MAG TPA: hypothetical protein VEA69_00650 [Tepidisphaeraceae bacterium]|nr:hypothetical protein [Tepidisphaeraceae bacterium]
MYRLLETPCPITTLPAWQPAAERSTEIVGWTIVGDLLLRDPVRGNYAVLRTRVPRIVQLIYTDLDEFLSDYIVPGVNPELARDLYGCFDAPAPDQVFVDPATPPDRNPPLEDYVKENVWAFAARAAAAFGLGHGRAVDRVLIQLRPGDDFWLWQTALDHILAELPSSVEAGALVQVGRCSHWLRPHQTRWTADGGFAFPAGYGPGFIGLPEFDWSEMLTHDGHIWTWATDKSVRPVLRIAIPSRTCRHDQAAVHTRWSLGRDSETRFFGFRRKDDRWTCTAESDWKEDRVADRRQRRDPRTARRAR